jgi:hypothetical protein
MISFGSDYGESKSVQNRGASMTTTMTMTTTTTTTGSRRIGRSRLLASTAMLFGAIFTILLLPAYGQQDVDPTWYDPWAPAAAVVNPAQPPAVAHLAQSPLPALQYRQADRSATSAADSGKLRVKGTHQGQSRHHAGHNADGNPAADNGVGAARLAGSKQGLRKETPHPILGTV